MDDAYFNSMYRDDNDPWGFETRFYEQRKYDLTIASLTRDRYRSAFEPGCSNGVLTAKLAERCDQLVGCDIVDSVVDRARERTAELDHVTIEHGRFPDFWPDTRLDLVIWSEVAYYLSSPRLVHALTELDARLDGDGELVVVGYTGQTNYPQTTESVDRSIEACGWLRRHTEIRSELFHLAVWRR